jgi:hypothetical protein
MKYNAGPGGFNNVRSPMIVPLFIQLNQDTLLCCDQH